MIKIKRRRQLKNKSNYVDNEKFLKEILEYKKAVKANKGEKVPVPDSLARFFCIIAKNLSSKGNFASYTYKDDMVSDSIENCFERNTKILTIEYGPAPIGELVGKTVTVKAADGNWRKATVRSFGKQKLYRYGFGSFNLPLNQIQNFVIATKDHRWFLKARRKNPNRQHSCLIRKNEIVNDLRLGDILQFAPTLEEMDQKGIIHGLIFGDGCVNRKPQNCSQVLISSQGAEYPFIRVCKQDICRSEIESILLGIGCVPTYPKFAKGDPVFYLPRELYLKDFPFTCDPSYIKGFIYGWWLADGVKTSNVGERRRIITTVDSDAVSWLKDYAAYAGYTLVGSSVRKNRKTNFSNTPKPLHTILLASSENFDAKVRSIEEWGEDEVFCVDEPITHGFVLANGLLTGNCLKYVNNFDPKKSTNPFSYFTQIISFAFIRRIKKEKKQAYIRYKSFMNSDLIEDEEIMNKIRESDALKDYKQEYIDSFEKGLEKKKVKKENKSVKKVTDFFKNA